MDIWNKEVNDWKLRIKEQGETEEDPAPDSWGTKWTRGGTRFSCCLVWQSYFQFLLYSPSLI